MKKFCFYKYLKKTNLRWKWPNEIIDEVDRSSYSRSRSEQIWSSCPTGKRLRSTLLTIGRHDGTLQLWLWRAKILGLWLQLPHSWWVFQKRYYFKAVWAPNIDGKNNWPNLIKGDRPMSDPGYGPPVDELDSVCKEYKAG